jgi:hypothetical protein
VWVFDIYAAVSSATNVTKLIQNLNRVRAGSGTLTTTDLTATSKTATASTGTPFALATGIDIGTVETAVVTVAGSGYAVGNILTVVQAGASGCTLRVLTVGGGGSVATFEILTKGVGYTVAAGKATTVSPSGGTNCTIGVTAINAIDSVSFLRTTTGYFKILTYVSDTVVTIEVPATYTNQSNVAYSVHKKLFGVTTPEINNTATAPLWAGLQLYTLTTAQPAFTVLTTDKIASSFFGISDGNRSVYFSHNGTSRYSHFSTPLITLHGNLAGLQGGTGSVPAEEYYHMTLAQHTSATRSATASQDGLATPTQIAKLDGIAAGAGVPEEINMASLKTMLAIVSMREFTFVLHRGENATTGTAKTNTLVVSTPMTIVECYAYAKTAPTGAGLVFDINKNGTTIWTNQANRITIADGENLGNQTSFDVTTLAENDLLSIDIDVIGSTVAGSDITVLLKCTIN